MQNISGSILYRNKEKGRNRLRSSDCSVNFLLLSNAIILNLLTNRGTLLGFRDLKSYWDYLLSRDGTTCCNIESAKRGDRPRPFPSFEILSRTI